MVFDAREKYIVKRGQARELNIKDSLLKQMIKVALLSLC